MISIAIKNIYTIIPIQVGVAMFAGLGVMVVLLPFNGFITAKVGKYQKQQMAKKDERLKLMNEILNGIKVSIWEVMRNLEMKLINTNLTNGFSHHCR